jgi:two-component system, OmpR family, sensor histidine kinase VicK
MGLSSYLILVGIYSSAISVAQDTKLRQTIRKSTTEESKLLISIGSAQLEQEIQGRAVKVAKDQQQTMAEQTGVQSSLTEHDMKQYVSEVLKEIKVLQSVDEILKKGREILESSSKSSICSKYGGMRLVYNNYFALYEKIMLKFRSGEHGGIRLVTTIMDRESADLVKKFINIGVQIRHVKNMPPIDFAVSDKEMIAAIQKIEDGQVIQNLLVSNEQPYISHFTSIFDELWNSGIDAKEKIKAIEEGVEPEGIDIIHNPFEIQELSSNLIRSATNEILIIFSTANAFHRQEYRGGMQLLKEAASRRRVKIRILTPKDNLIEETVQKLRTYKIEGGEQEEEEKEQGLSNQIEIRYIERPLQTKISILVVDSKFSLVVELKDDTKETSYEAMGLATYSNSKSTVLSYASIFESLWRQTELYQQVKEANEQLELANEKLKIHDKMQKEFIDIAAHELRTPIQPILGLTEIIKHKTKDPEQLELLDVTIRNAKRLQRLTEDILDVTRIESQTLHLRKERFNLSEMINNAIADSRNQIKKEYRDNIKLELISKEDIFVEADRNRIYQVILNLLGNAIKFTKEEGIIVTTAEKKDSHVVISVKDNGQGIDPDILPRLFTKFATKSETGGTGLGLFISKSIIEAHCGKIWTKNNSFNGNAEKGAVFYFSLPLSR